MAEQSEPSQVVETCDFETAAEFLDALSPRCDNLWNGNAGAWIFRGQGNIAWHLSPTAVRDLTAFQRFGVIVPDEGAHQQAWSRRAQLVNQMLVLFQAGLDRAGVVIPSPSLLVRRHNTYRLSSEPEHEVFPLMALAQHHGLPTLLLDWTRRAWVAAYFAAVQSVELPQPRPRMAVWALCRAQVPVDDEGDLRIYEAPGGTNPNLRAQAGLFTLLSREDDIALEHHVALSDGVPRLRKLSLAASEGPTVLRLLSDEGIDGSAMFPGSDGVVRAMRERALWQTVG